MIRNIPLLVILLLITFQASATATKCEIDKSNTKYIFGNGMFNRQTEITGSSAALSSLLKLKTNYCMVIVGESINNNEFILNQLIEVARQNLLTDWSLFWGWLGGGSASPQWFKDATQDLSGQADKLNYLIDEDLQAHVSEYIKEIEKGNKVVVVAHSH